MSQVKFRSGEHESPLTDTDAALQQRKLAAAFDKLMGDISVSLEAKNRDRFTHNLTCFRHQMKEML